ncbi:MAG: 5'/3'-nucleotidase SurE [Janthinobacterium lividum]
MLERILLTNDDGIDAPGLLVMEQIAAELAHEVWVIAPEYDRSGSSHAISLHTPLRVSERSNRHFAISGTPGDCVAIGLGRILRGKLPDLVVSGVNLGANLGVETVFSGTVGAAMTAMFLGVPSFAVSQTYGDRNAVHWDTVRANAPKVLRQLLSLDVSHPTCLSVNFPDCPSNEVGELKATRQGHGTLNAVDVITQFDPRGFEYHWLSLRHTPREEALNAEAVAIEAKNITVTPLMFERTDEQLLRQLYKVVGVK